eukprot:6326346-Pyramimonas_sp.AAC.1
MGEVVPYEPCRWGLRWSSLWGHGTCEGCAEIWRWHHANPAAWAFGGAPNGATERARGAPKWDGAAMRTMPLEPS